MKYKNIYALLLLGTLLWGGLASCSSEEDTTPSFQDVNGFAPSDDDTSVEATLKRGFFDKTGVYLLFNDTLSVTQKGVDYYGQPIYDVQTVNVDFSSFNGNVDVYRYTYDYIKDDVEKQKAADLLNEQVLSCLGTMQPYSVLLVNGISQWEKNKYGEWVLTEVDSYYNTNPHPTYRLGTRCYVFSVENGQAFSDPTFFISVLQEIVKDRISSKGKSFLDDFKALVNNYDDLTAQWDDKQDLGFELGKNDDLARSLGFLRDWNRYYFPSSKTDLNDYISAVFSYSVAEFEEAFANYPICIARFKLMREKIQGMGVKLPK